MSKTTVLNPKTNIKQYTNADYPVQPRQPVLQKMAPVESTASQTVINLSFAIDTVNAADSLMLMVDGKVLSVGSAYDFTFTSIDSLGFSSQVTLTAAIPAGLNIQAWKLGLKKENEFGVDTRFTNLYNALDDSFQGYVTLPQMTATATTGSPGTGLFHSTITNRSSMPDLRLDLKPRMGIERIPIQNVYQIQNEFGPNGETVYGTVNDIHNQIRLIGNISNNVSANGPAAVINLSDSVEITFYGTGLNIALIQAAAGQTYTFTVTDNGGATLNTITQGTTNSNILQNRNYATNVFVNAVSGLTLGVHTVKITYATQSTVGAFNFHGFEVLNESSSLKINQGDAYKKGQKYSASIQNVLAYNAAVTGTNGGRVVSYLNADGSIGQAFKAVDASPAYLSSASHTNEEVVRTYYPREFGASRWNATYANQDDFSQMVSVARAAGFTLDDGTTTLTTSSGVISAIGGVDAFSISGTTNHMTLTFVGTGLDILTANAGGTGANITVFVDSVSQGAITWKTDGTLQKIVSGLPYGTHTVRLTRNDTNNFGIIKYIVYQPKKPTVPAAAIELSDYNVMATYTATTTNDHLSYSKGVLAKAASREMVYVGTFDATTVGAVEPFYTDISTTTNGDLLEYTFFGTGFELFARDSGAAATYTVKIDGAFYTGAATVVGSNTPTWTPASSLWSVNTVGQGGKLQITGLSLATHKITLTKASGSALRFMGLAVITPLHSYKLNTYYDLQNTLSIGSNAIADSRKFTPVKAALSTKKNSAQAVGVTSAPTTTSTALIPMPDMTITLATNTGDLDIAFHSTVTMSVLNNDVICRIYVNGLPVGAQTKVDNAANAFSTLSNSAIAPVPAGVHKIDVYWASGNGASTATAIGTERVLKVREI